MKYSLVIFRIDDELGAIKTSKTFDHEPSAVEFRDMIDEFGDTVYLIQSVYLFEDTGTGWELADSWL